MSGKTLGQDYFDRLYADKPDPWDFLTSAYEKAKYAASIAALGERRYMRAWEVGCSIGVFTASLAAIADQLISTDLAARALQDAAARNRATPHVRFETMAFPREAPSGIFDLIVLSEVLYYLDRADLDDAVGVVIDHLAHGGDVLLVHWLGETDYPLTGDEAAARFIEQAGRRLTTILQTRHERYRLDLLRHTS